MLRSRHRHTQIQAHTLYLDPGRHTHEAEIQAHTGGSDPGRGTHTKLHVEMFSGNLTPCVNRLSKLLHRGEILKIFNFNDDKVSAQHCRWQTFSPSAAVQNFMLETFPTQSQSDLKEWVENLTGWHPSVSQYLLCLREIF